MAVNKSHHPFDKTRFEALLSRRFFYAPAFEIYGGIAGLYDYGPPGSALQSNIIAEWRKHFIIEEGMHEVDTTVITPSPVFEASGHVARFADWMVKDTKTGDVIRADHLVKGVLKDRLEGDQIARGLANAPVEQAPTKKKKKEVKNAPVQLSDEAAKEYEYILAKLDDYTGDDLHKLIQTHAIKNPDTGNDVSAPILFNLMFPSSIGPTGQVPGFLRPETAQGHFLNFPRLLDYSNNKLPFASAQIGRSFRNEISPRAGLLRVREFTMAEIEHFVDPLDKNHPRFAEVANVTLGFLGREVQESGKSDLTYITVGEAVGSGLVGNQTLGYFVARIYLYLTKIGIDPKRLRFRQHMSNEMAHYASDCWDAEIYLGNYGWIECVGCADRAAYDLTVHERRTGVKLRVREALKEPKIEELLVPEWDRKELGKGWGKDGKWVVDEVGAYEQARLGCIKQDIEEKGQVVIKKDDGTTSVTLPSGIIRIEKKTVKTSVREYTPNVIEPSFGLGRILYSLLEHSYWCRESDVDRGVLSLNALVAPTKVLIVPLSSKEEFDPLVKDVSSRLRTAGIFSRVDDSNTSIGRRYARNDELGTPFGVTLDFASVKNGTMTLRERDTTTQLIGPIEAVIDVIKALVDGDLTWEAASKGEGELASKLKVYDGVQDVD